MESDSVPMRQSFPTQAFPFTVEQCQRILAMIGGLSNSQGNMAAPKVVPIAMANSVTAITSLAGTFFNLKHSVFATKVMNRNAFSCNTWVLDIGAIDHIICDVSLLTSVTTLTYCVVELPNGESAQVTHISTVKLSATLILDHVLCGPSFSFNSLSISKLTQQLPYRLVFLSQFCFIQELSSWKMIGIGEVHNGLYLLQRSDCINSSSLADHLLKHKSDPLKHKFGHSFSLVNSVTNMPRVWHFRLGHPSMNKLLSLQDSLFVSFDSCDDVCNICPKAKQKRLPFPFNNNFSSFAFNLVHVDI